MNDIHIKVDDNEVRTNVVQPNAGTKKTSSNEQSKNEGNSAGSGGG